MPREPYILYLPIPGAFLPSENHFFLDLMMSDAEIRDSEADIGPYFFSYASITISRATSITSLIFSELSMAICRNINEVIDVALDMVIEAYEKKYGPISASESRISASDIIRSRKK